MSPTSLIFNTEILFANLYLQTTKDDKMHKSETLQSEGRVNE